MNDLKKFYSFYFVLHGHQTDYRSDWFFNFLSLYNGPVEQVVRASAFTFGVVYGSLKLKVLKVCFHRLLKKPSRVCCVFTYDHAFWSDLLMLGYGLNPHWSFLFHCHCCLSGVDFSSLLVLCLSHNFTLLTIENFIFFREFLSPNWNSFLFLALATSWSEIQSHHFWRAISSIIKIWNRFLLTPK